MLSPETKRGVQHEAEMSADVIEILRAHGTRRTFGKNQMVVGIGDDFDHLFLIESGRFSFSMMNDQEDLAIYGYKAEGSTWGLTAAILGKPAFFIFESVEESVATCVHRDTLWSLIDSNPVVRRGIILGLGWAVRQSISVGHEQLTLPLRRRLINFLIANANEHGNIELSQSVIARNLGVSRYALGMHLQKLKRASLIEIEYRRVRVLNADKLSRTGTSV